MELGADTGTKVHGLAGRIRGRREAKRAERLHGENDRLRAQLQMTRSELDHERGLEHEMLDALNKAAERPTNISAPPKAGLFRMATVAAVAYVFGTRAGHERYEQMRSWLSEIRDRMSDSVSSPVADGVITSSPGMGPRPNPLIESGVRRS